MRIEVAELAEGQIRSFSEWWDVNRPSAPGLFLEELLRAETMLARFPRIGRHWRWRHGHDVRRLLLRRCRCHVYYRVDSDHDCVLILAIWHASRGKPPTLSE